MTLDDGLPEDVLRALRERRRISAIKRLREQCGIGLQAAKQRVDDYLSTHPERAARTRPRAESGQGPTKTFVTVAPILAALAAAGGLACAKRQGVCSDGSRRGG